MKRMYVLTVVVALVLLAWGSIASGVTFKIGGGYSMLSSPEYDDYLEGGISNAVMDNLSSAFPLTVEVMFGSSDGIGFSASITRFGSNATRIWSDNFELQQAWSVLGGAASGLYSVGMGRSSLYFGGGLGYYSVKKTSTLTYPHHDPFVEYKLSGSQLGYHGLTGFSYSFTDNIGLFVEGMYRVLNIPEDSLTISEGRVDDWNGEPWWGPAVSLGGINILVGLTVSI